MSKSEKRLRRRAERVARRAENEQAAVRKQAAAQERFRAALRTLRCPACGAAQTRWILYGMPNYDADLQADLDAGIVALGGCVCGADNPDLECRACGHAWGSADHPRPGSAEP